MSNGAHENFYKIDHRLKVTQIYYKKGNFIFKLTTIPFGLIVLVSKL